MSVKCTFFRQSVTYLGHILSREGVQADTSKIEKVVTWPKLNSTKEVQRFLGFMSYYCRFIQNFTSIAKPLHRITERAAPFKWSAQCQAAFEELWHWLVAAPILAHPNFSLHFILDTDASDTGLGVVFSQMDDEGWVHVIAYGIRVLSKAERRYCVTQQELLVVVTFTQ